jgi:hypothetical protein
MEMRQLRRSLPVFHIPGLSGINIRIPGSSGPACTALLPEEASTKTDTQQGHGMVVQFKFRYHTRAKFL